MARKRKKRRSLRRNKQGQFGKTYDLSDYRGPWEGGHMHGLRDEAQTGLSVFGLAALGVLGYMLLSRGK